jgi:hypothetical protein
VRHGWDASEWECPFLFARDRVTLRLGAAARQGRPAEA